MFYVEHHHFRSSHSDNGTNKSRGGYSHLRLRSSPGNDHDQLYRAANTRTDEKLTASPASALICELNVIRDQELALHGAVCASDTFSSVAFHRHSDRMQPSDCQSSPTIWDACSHGIWARSSRDCLFVLIEPLHQPAAFIIVPAKLRLALRDNISFERVQIMEPHRQRLYPALFDVFTYFP
jgi:hypothetical protein